MTQSGGHDVRGSAVPPTRDDPVVTALSEVVGGRLGDHAARHPWWTPVRVMLALTAVIFALGMLQKGPCATTQWQDGSLRYTHMCYSDLPYLYTGRGLAELNWPYSDDEQVRARFEVMEYPVGISYWAWGAAHVTQWLSGSPDVADRAARPVSEVGSTPEVVTESVRFVAVNAVGFALLALLSTWFLAAVNRGRPWDAAGFAAAPALLLTGLINWDLLAVVAVAGALWAWARGRPGLTGVMIGLGAALKLYPLFLLGGLLVICVRQRRWAHLLVATLAAVVAWLIANAPALLTGPEQWRVFWTFNSERGPDLGSVWIMVSQMGWTPGTDLMNDVSWLFFLLWCGGVLVLGLAAPSTPRLAQLGLLIVLGFLLVNKVYSPQYVLWLLPLAVLARPRWRDLLVWQAAEVAYFAAVWWYLGGWLAVPGETETAWYWGAIVVRLLGQLYLGAVVIRDVLRPHHDPAGAERDAEPVEWGPTVPAARLDVR